MLLCRRDCLFGIGQLERVAFVPGLPLVHVIGTEKISSLTGDQVQRALVQIGQVHRQTLRRPMAARYRFHRIATARLRPGPRAGPALQQRNPAQDRMLDLYRSKFSPLPRSQILRRLRSTDRSLNRRGKQIVVTAIGLRKPTRRLMVDHIFQPHRLHPPGISLPTQRSR